MTSQGVSERRALALVRMSASLLRYTPAPDTNAALRARIVALAHQHRRYGAGMIYLKLRQAGALVNHKRVERLYTEARLQVRRRRRKKIPVADRQPLIRPQAPNEVWSADFVFDRTADGRVVKCLTVVDDATTEAVAIVPARTLGGLPVTRVLDRLAFERGLPRVLRTACYEQVVKALGAVGPSNRGTDTGSGSVEPAHRASFRTHTRGAEGARRKYVELSSTRRAQDKRWAWPPLRLEPEPQVSTRRSTRPSTRGQHRTPCGS